MKTALPFLLQIVLLSFACKSNQNVDQIEVWKNEIVQTEKEFAEMAASKGLPEAFTKYAAEDVAILRGNIILRGRKALSAYYKAEYSGPEKVTLTWKPDFVDVSASGDLGYTYGKYHYQITDTLGQRRSLDGVFHTVWKRQADGTWRFVWD